MPKFDVAVKLVGTDGNAFAIMGKVKGALKSAGASSEEVKLFLEEAMSGDYSHLLRTCTKWVNVK